MRSRGPEGARRALLVHGLNGDGATWERVAEKLVESGWRVVTVDLRGHGSAPEPDDYTLAGYASDLPRDNWDLVVGQSLGGASALIAASTPGFAQRLVLLDPVLEIDPADRDAIIDDQVAELALTIESLTEAKPHWHPRDIASKVAAAHRSSLRTATASFTDNPDWNAVDAGRAVAVPTLILGGDHGVYSMLATETAESITRANPNVSYTVVAGTGHSPQRDRFEETLALILAFAG